MNDMAETPCLAISLADLLASRDARANRQQQWLSEYNQPLISATLVWPGEVKDSPLSRAVMQVAVDALSSLIATHRWEINKHEVRQLVTGPEAYWSITAPSLQLKSATVLLEDSHPLGRLWDLDVFSTELGLLSRASIQKEKRRCFICHEPAHACSRMRRHSYQSLKEVMEKITHDYFCSEK